MSRSPGNTKYRIMNIDPYLQPFYYDVDLRMQKHLEMQMKLLHDSQDLSTFANGYLYYGFHRTDAGWVYREWAPGADAIHLIGDFNGWDRASHPLKRLENGDWEISLNGHDALQHMQRVKIQITKDGETFDRIPAYIRRAVFDGSSSQLTGQIWAPARAFPWTDGGYGRRKVSPLSIYEVHIGISSEEERIGTYREFADTRLAHIQQLGYNALLLLAVMEHPYYASFGFQVTNFFAPSSRFGTPEDLKYLVDKAHEMGMFVIMDMVHAHACPNVGEGLNLFDGTDDQFFVPGVHPIWGSRVFNYGKNEVLHFLLSDLKFWLEEYHMDGFRFNGVTSMIYQNHGLGAVYSDYKQYFSMNTNIDAVAYLQLANELVHSVNPLAVTIAEEVSGMPGVALPIRSGGIGFDYRLNMALPEFWRHLVLDVPDQDWDLFTLWYELTNRRPKEKNVGYVESHEQAFAGKHSLFASMVGEEIYSAMEKGAASPRVDRGMALHMLIRFITVVLASEAYMNFMGDEFGHPDIVDMPREENNWSYRFAKRQWSLVREDLKYAYLEAFDQAMQRFARKYRVLSKPAAVNLWIDNSNKIIAFAKGDLIYVFNFGPEVSPTDFFVPVRATGEGRYQCIFDTDRAAFGGQERISDSYIYDTQEQGDKGPGFYVYIPCRTAAVYKRIGEKP